MDQFCIKEVLWIKVLQMQAKGATSAGPLWLVHRTPLCADDLYYLRVQDQGEN
jgi:hypothetical protein